MFLKISVTNNIRVIIKYAMKVNYINFLFNLNPATEARRGPEAVDLFPLWTPLVLGRTLFLNLLLSVLKILYEILHIQTAFDCQLEKTHSFFVK